MKYLYLSLDILSLAGPLLLSFDKKVAFYKNWKPLLFSIFVMMLVFIPWDVWKTAKGVWGFNENYILGIYFYNLPLEECLFFICIPYACMFIHECVLAYIKSNYFQKSFKQIYLSLAFILIAIGLIFNHKWYAAVTFPFAGIMLLLNLKFTNQKQLSMFIISYFIILLPFLLVNGILTGSFIDEPVVWYSSKHIFNIRIFTIPIEDTVYNLAMLMLTLLVYDFSKRKLGI